MGVTEKKVEKEGTSGGARTMTGACPTDLLYSSRSLPAAYRNPGSLDPREPCASGPRATIDDTIPESLVEAREERRHSERRMGTVNDMADIVTFCEGACRKQCHLRLPPEASDEQVTSCSSGLNNQALPQTRFAKTDPGGSGIGNGNDSEPCTPDVQCSVGLRGISYLLLFG